MEEPNVSLERVAEICDAVDAFLGAMTALELRAVVSPGSPASAEWAAFEQSKDLANARQQAVLCFEVAVEHLEGVILALRSERHTTLPFSSLRVLIESTAIALWLLDPAIKPAARAHRGFAVRYESLTAQRSLAGTLKKRPWPSDFATDWDDERRKVDDRIEILKTEAGRLGIVEFRRKTRENGDPNEWPGPTRLVEEVLGIDSLLFYRSASAVVHSSPTQILGLSFAEDPRTKPGEPALRKSLLGTTMAIVLFSGLEHLARLVWAVVTHYGEQKDAVGSLLDDVYDKIGIADSKRFWRFRGSV